MTEINGPFVVGNRASMTGYTFEKPERRNFM